MYEVLLDGKWVRVRFYYHESVWLLVFLGFRIRWDGIELKVEGDRIVLPDGSAQQLRFERLFNSLYAEMGTGSVWIGGYKNDDTAILAKKAYLKLPGIEKVAKRLKVMRHFNWVKVWGIRRSIPANYRPKVEYGWVDVMDLYSMLR